MVRGILLIFLFVHVYGWIQLNQNYFNPGDPHGVFDTQFEDPEVLLQYGFNGKIGRYIEAAIEFSTLPGATWFPPNCSGYHWLKAMQLAYNQEISLAKGAGLKVYYHIDFIVLPKTVVNFYKDQILAPNSTYIDITLPKTQEIMQIFFDEFFQTFPQVDGLMIRVGELYQQDLPYHTGNLPFTTTEGASGEAQYVNVINFLKEQISVRNNKTLFFRTWDTYPDRMHANETYYLTVTDQIVPHPNLYFSIKHTALDYWRRVRFNPCLAVGNHQQIVEVEISREYEGKGAYPNYIGNGVIEGFEELLVKKGLQDIINSPLLKGAMTWARGGGWNGPYIKCNEFWPQLNLYVITQWFQNPKLQEPEIFAKFATSVMGLSDVDAGSFYKFALLSATAVLQGRYCYAYDKTLNQTLMPTGNWMRDDGLGGLNQLNSVFTYLYSSNLFEEALAEKQSSVEIWEQMGQILSTISFPDPQLQNKVYVGWLYGQTLFQIVSAGWGVMATGFIGDHTKSYNLTLLSSYLQDYDNSWAAYNAFGLSYSHMATLYLDTYNFGGPGIGATIDTYRKLVNPTC